jgi:16S rRNA (cytidine1402-2'-O)-methyltransferase
MSGTLFVVATPIGNLEDITLRALRVLREVDLIAAEDTRRTAKLLAHYEIRCPMTSLREHNETRMAASLLARLESGNSIALVSDAGTPGLADPGQKLVSLARQRRIPIVPVPGASAVTAALSVSGLAVDEFVFMGFPPPAGTARTEWLNRASAEVRPVVFFEAPHRIARTLSELSDLVDRPIAIFRELTKLHEKSVIRPIVDAVTDPLVSEPRGEYVLVLAPADSAPGKQLYGPAALSQIATALVRWGGLDDEAALQFIARATDSDRRQIAKLIKKHRISVKQQSQAGS